MSVGTATESVRLPELDLGKTDGQNACNWQKPLFIALIILGIIGLGAAVTGGISYGSHLGLWGAGCLSNVSQIQAMMLMIGGATCAFVCLVIGIVGCAKVSYAPKYSKEALEDLAKDKTDLKAIDKLLQPKTFTFVLQANGNYAFVLKHPLKPGQTQAEIEEVENDIALEGLDICWQQATSADYTFVNRDGILEKLKH